MKDKVNYKELELLVRAYQDGSHDAAVELVERFRPYLQKFTYACKDGRFDIADRTQRNFIGLFLPKKHRKILHTFRRNVDIQREVYKYLNYIRKSLEHIDEEDFHQQCIEIFFTLAKRHNHSAPLSKYLKQIYPYRIFDWVVPLIKDENDKKKFEIYYYEEMPEAATYDHINYETVNKKHHLISSQNPTDYDENWVNGYTCGPLFKDFTTHERRLIRWYYEWKALAKQGYDQEIYQMYKERFKHTEQEIADLLGCSRKTINFKRNAAKSRLKEKCLELNLLQSFEDK